MWYDILFTLTFLLPFTLIFTSILAYFMNRLDFWNMTIGLFLGYGVYYFANDLIDIIILPIKNVLIYGYEMNFMFYSSITYVAGLALMGMVAFYNLWMTEGQKLWR